MRQLTRLEDLMSRIRTCEYKDAELDFYGWHLEEEDLEELIDALEYNSHITHLNVHTQHVPSYLVVELMKSTHLKGVYLPYLTTIRK